jgi:hypothetical protein
MGVMTEAEAWPRIARPYRSDAEREEWDKVFRVLRVEGEAEREAIKAKLDACVDHYAHARWWHRDDPREGPWRKSMLQCTGEMKELLRAVPYPYDLLDGLFGDLPDAPSGALAMLEQIEKVLLPNGPSPRPAHRPKANYSDLIELVARVAPIYRDRTNKNPAATAGPFMRMMRALLTIAGERPVDNAIRAAIRAYMGKVTGAE